MDNHLFNLRDKAGRVDFVAHEVHKNQIYAPSSWRPESFAQGGSFNLGRENFHRRGRGGVDLSNGKKGVTYCSITESLISVCTDTL